MSIINVLYCLDDFTGEYTRHLAVSILSLLQTNAKNTVNIYIISSCLSHDNQKELSRIVTLYNQNITFYISDTIIPLFIKVDIINVRKSLTMATFYRLFFHQYIPLKTGYIIYLDCDTLVNRDLSDIFSIDMGEYPVMGGYDVGGLRYHKYKTLGIKHYINAGVLLINISQWSSVDFCSGIRESNKHFGNKITADDQDYLNIILQGKIMTSPTNFNCIIYRKFAVHYQNAYIIHMTNKPFWKYPMVPSAIVEMYYRYLGQTLWKDFRPHVNSQKSYFVRYCRILFVYISGIAGGIAGEYYGELIFSCAASPFIKGVLFFKHHILRTSAPLGIQKRKL